MKKILAALHILLMSSGCASYLNELTPEAAHQNFLRELHSTIGQDIITSNYTNFQPSLRISEERLANGLIQYRYRSGVGKGECKSIYDVDPATHKIVQVGFEGTMKQCSLPP